MIQLKRQRLHALQKLIRLVDDLHPDAIPVYGANPWKQQSKIDDTRRAFMRPQLGKG
jgi:hypothetical protein